MSIFDAVALLIIGGMAGGWAGWYARDTALRMQRARRAAKRKLS